MNDWRNARIEEARAWVDNLLSGNGFGNDYTNEELDQWALEMVAMFEKALGEATVTPTDADEVISERDETTDENLWDFAGDLLDAWNIEDTNSPSLIEDFRDRFVARFRRTEVPEPSVVHQEHADARRAETMTLMSHSEPQGEPSDAQTVKIFAEALDNVPPDIAYQRGPRHYWIEGYCQGREAALRAANEVR